MLFPGVYVESSICWVDDSLLAANSLSGISVVRSGFVSLSGSDITENGVAPYLIEDMYDVVDAARLHGEGVSIRGGLVEGPQMNNFASIYAPAGKNTKLFKGGAIRDGGTLVAQLLKMLSGVGG